MGQRAADLTWKTDTGTGALSGLNSEGAVIAITDQGCPVSKRYFPTLTGLATAYPQIRLLLIAVGGGDVQVGTWRDGLLVQGSVVSGDNWMSLDGADNPGGFVTSQVAVSFYFPIDNDRIAGVEPIGRISVADPDDGIDDNGGLLITPGFMIYFMGKNKIGFNYDYYSPATGDSVSGFRFGTFLYF